KLQSLIASPAGPELYWNDTPLVEIDTGPSTAVRPKPLPVVANQASVAVLNEYRSSEPPLMSSCAPSLPRYTVTPVTDTLNNDPVTAPEVAAVAATPVWRVTANVDTDSEPSPVTVTLVEPPLTWT